MTRYLFSYPVTALLTVTILAVYGLELAGLVDPTAAGFIPASPTLLGAFGSLFLHDPGNLGHIVGNLVFLVVFGLIVEPALGSLRFATLYGAAGALGVGLHWCVDPTSTNALVGASGAIFGIMAVAAVMRPKLLGLAIGFMAMNVWFAFRGEEGISFGCHTGGFLIGVVSAALLKLQGDEALEAA